MRLYVMRFRFQQIAGHGFVPARKEGVTHPA